MILHLLKTDWQRLRWPILGLWLLAVLSALPWMFHSPESFTAPWWNDGSWNGSLPDSVIGDKGSNIWRILAGIMGFATYALSTAIGILGVSWQGAMPLSRWKAAASKLLSLFLFIALPQFLVGALVLLVQRFPITTVFSTGLGIILSLLLLHSLIAYFARLCGSGWTWLAGIAILQGLTIVLNQLIPGRLFKPFYSDPLLSEKEPHLWALCSLALLGMFIFPKLMRTQSGKPLAVTAALLALIVASFATRRVPTVVVLPTEKIAATSLENTSVTATPGSVRHDDQAFNGKPNEVRVSVTPTTTGTLPSDTFVVWADDKVSDSPWDRINLYPDTDSHTDRAALEPLLPAPLAPWPRGHTHGDSYVSLTLSHDELTAKTELSIPLRGHVFRYEQIADFALSENTLSQRSGAFTFATRQLPDSNSNLLIDLVIQGPANAITKDGLELPNPQDGAEAFRIILYAPADELCLQLSPQLEQSARIPGGAQLIRRVFSPENQDAFQSIDRTSLRVLIFKPVSLAQIKRTLTFDATDELSDTNSDWQLSRNYHLGLEAYLANHRPNRPDPEHATEAEAARYFRAVSATFDQYEIIGADLAEYAPRFSKLLTLHAKRSPCATAIGLGTPDDRRMEVLDTIEVDPTTTRYLASIVAQRGWQNEAVDSFIQILKSDAKRGFLDPHIREELVESIATLEDPKTYPTLLNCLERTNSWRIYNSVRQLPGISSALDETIIRMSQTASPFQETSSSSYNQYFAVFDSFRPTVFHGNPEALTKLLEFWKLSTPDDFNFGKVQRIAWFIQPEPAIPNTMKAWNTFLAGKTAADFTHDPLTLKWRAASDSK